MTSRWRHAASALVCGLAVACGSPPRQSTADTAPETKPAADASQTKEPMAELLEQAGSDDVQTRLAALEQIEARDAASDVGPLIEALSSESAMVRQVACKKLRTSGSAAAVAPLLKILEHDDTASVRRSCAVALGELGGAEVVQPLLKSARGDESEDVRKFAAVALGTAGYGEAAAGLGDALVGAQPESSLVVREAIVRALGTLGDPRGVAPLVQLYASESDPAVLEALAAIGGDDADRFLRETLATPGSGEGRLTVPGLLLARDDGAHDEFLLRQAKSADEPEVRAQIYAAAREADLSPSRRARFIELARTDGEHDSDSGVRDAAAELRDAAAD